MPNHDLVVIGGSLGARSPLRTILNELSADFPAAVLVVLHTSSDSNTGVFYTVASASSALPVKNAEDGEPVLPGHIYLAPPNRHLLLINGKITLGSGPRENLSRPAIDPLFRSAALSHGSRAIGVVLSGLLNDGASGLATIKATGGVALVQAPPTAEAGDMPLSALEATSVDLSASPKDLARAIVHLVRQTAGQTLVLPASTRVEVEIAAGHRVDTSIIEDMADPVAITCPECGGVLSQMRNSAPLRFRCQVGHALTAKAVAQEQIGAVDEAMRVAFRIIEERATLTNRMKKDAEAAGRQNLARMYGERATEYREYADLLREAVTRIVTTEETGEIMSEATAFEATAKT